MVAVALVVGVAILVLAPAGDLYGIPSADPLLSPNLSHPFGTDDLGRDLLLAVAQGARTSLLDSSSPTNVMLSPLAGSSRVKFGCSSPVYSYPGRLTTRKLFSATSRLPASSTPSAGHSAMLATRSVPITK